MKPFCKPIRFFGLFTLLAAGCAHGATLIIGDTYNVTGTGSGFALNAGVNSGINPPTTRLTGSAVANLRYLNTGTKATTAYTLTSQKVQVSAAANPGRFVLSADGTSSFDFSSALGSAGASPGNPVVYDLAVSIKNNSSGTQRCSFALGTAESDAYGWSFGLQLYRTNSTSTRYVLGKRIDTSASGLASDLNSAVYTFGTGTYGTEIAVLLRVTDAGAETGAFHSRVQLSLNGGSTWIYDTATDPDLPNGWCWNAPGRHLMWDIAPDAGPVTYDNFSLNWNSGPRTWSGAGANGNWSTAANWGGAVPVAGSALTFNGTSRQANTNDLSGLSVPWLRFNNGGFALHGNVLTVSGAVTNSAGANAWNGTLTAGGALRLQSEAGTLTLGNVAGGAQTVAVGGAGNTTLGGVLSGTGGLTKDGSGTLTLGGANTYSGVTTISAGTLALGAAGSLASSPTITLATGATFNVSAVSGYTLAGTQTLARNATSGAGTVAGSVTFASGAAVSLLANGPGKTVGSLNITGNLVLNNNPITINVSGGALDAGSYALVTYTGTRNGTFNLTPALTGSGLKAGLTATIFETPGLVALKVVAMETNAVFRVMTYNVHSGQDPVTGAIDTTRTANFITGNDIDLVVLNEVARYLPRSNNRDIIGEIAQKTGYAYVFGNNIPTLDPPGEFGNAILSRFPILSHDHRLLPNINGNEQRGWLQAIVDVQGKYISFQATHLDFHADSTERLMCATNINTWLAEETVPAIICGDFNDTPNSPVYNRMEDAWNDIWPTAGDGSLGRTVPCPGYPNNLNSRIDYIWKQQGASIKPVNAFVGYTLEASDHYPVISDFIFSSYTNHAAGFYFPFNEGTGSTTTADAIGGLQGSLGSGAPVWKTNSPSGQASDYSLYFNGSKTLSVPDPKQTIGPNPFNDDYTLQAWVKVAVNYAPAQRAILFQYERKPGFSFSLNTNRTLHTTTFKIKDIASTATLPNDGQWHHVAVVHTDGADMKFYIDTALAATVAYTNGAGYRTASTITMGSDALGANPFTGYLDRVQFSNRALTPAEFDFSAGAPQFLARAATSLTPAVKILGGQRTPDGGFTLTWTSVGSTRYRVQYADDLRGPFTDVARSAADETDPSPAGTPSQQSFTDTSAPTHGARFYRILVIP